METQQSTSQAPVGVLIFGRKRPGFDQDWNAEIRNRCRKSLAQAGFTLHRR